MDILCFSYGLAYANMYVLRFGNEAIVIDPCCPWDETGLSDVSVKAVLCTHGHFDHISEAEEILARFSCPLYISETCFLTLTSTIPRALDFMSR